MHIMKKQVLLIILLALPLWLKAADVSVTGLRTEQMVDPMGLDTAVPRMSWRLESSQRNVMQTAYRILVASSPELLAQDKGDLWDSGKVESDASVWILYQGKRLKSNQRVYWKVRSYTNRGETEWSEPARWGMGPLGEIHWGGRWIGWDAAFAWDREDSHSRLSSRYLRTEFKTQAKEIKYATLHLCGLGMYELFINGQRIGDQVLAPAPSDYRRTVLYNSFDVTKQVAGGNADNAIGVTLGNGRFYTMRQNYKPYKIPTFGYPKLRLNLIIEYTDGSIQRINSDEKWRLTAQGPIRSNNEYDGEIYDARMELGNWTQPGYDDSKWLKAQRVSLPYGTLRGNTAPNMKVMKTLKPAVFKQYGNRYMIDFGQNMAGWVRINIAKAAAGDTICIRYAERVKNDGTELDVENLRHSQSTDYYICNGKENNTSWSSRFSYHGFQYVEVTGYKNLKAEDLVAEVVYDDLEDNGTFECSNDIMNRVYRNAWWGISSNYKGVPLDCPQRDERQPWLGDHAMGTWGESFMFNNGNTYAKWADDIREAQREDGCIPDICPAYYNYYTSEMTWSSTFPVICDMVYEQFGNIEPIRKNYAAIKKWMHHIRSEFTTEDGVINADKYGDWCMPPESPELIHSQDPARKTDGALIATAYYYKVSQMLAKFARLQGLEDEAKEFEKDAAKIKDCFNARFLTVKKGTSPVQMPHVLYPDSIFYGNNTVTANILPLAFDMVPEAYREEVEKNVITGIITRNKGHISSGVIGMNWMMRELTRMGRGDVAFLLASNKTYPSYGYMIEKGATAIWELWNGDTANRWMNSCNHVMILGDLLTWYFRDLAGFNPAQPAYKRMLGGFIWDWVDQGIYKILPDGRQMVAYGGDFGDQPNLKAFCFNGVVMSDRETTPKYWEVKKVYAPVKLEMEKDLQVFPKEQDLLVKEQDVLPKGLRVTNRNHHIGLEGYRCLWTLIENGKKMEQGELALPLVAPGETGTMALPDVKINKQADVRLNVSIVLKEDALWAKAGHEILKEQFALNDHLMAVANGVQPGKRKNKFSVLDLWKDSYFQAFRAPTDNDKSFGNWLAKDWKNQRLDAPQVEVITPETETQETNGTVSRKSVVKYRYAKGSIRVSSHYKIYVDGTVDLEQTYLPQGELPELPRLGSAFVLGEEYENLSWYGRGPWENYPDRKTSCLIGRWSSKVSSQYTHYPRPQDSGNHEDVTEVTLTNKEGKGIRVTAIDRPFSFSALYYTVDDIYKATHDCDLKPRKEIILSLDAAVLGLGNF